MIAPSERHLEDWIVAHNGCITHPAAAYGDYSVVGRQVRLHSGIADLIVFNGSSLLVYELKKDKIDVHALAQILRYQSDLRDIWREVCKSLFMSVDQYFALFPFCVSGILLGHSVHSDILISANAANVVVYTYDFDGSTYRCRFAFKEGMRRGVAQEFAYGGIGEAMRKALTVYFNERSESPG